MCVPQKMRQPEYYSLVSVYPSVFPRNFIGAQVDANSWTDTENKWNPYNVLLWFWGSSSANRSWTFKCHNLAPFQCQEHFHYKLILRLSCWNNIIMLGLGIFFLLDASDFSKSKPTKQPVPGIYCSLSCVLSKTGISEASLQEHFHSCSCWVSSSSAPPRCEWQLKFLLATGVCSYLTLKHMKPRWQFKVISSFQYKR